MSDAGSGRSNTTLPEHQGRGRGGRRAWDERREADNSTKTGALGWGYESDVSQSAGEERASHVHHGRLDSGVTVRTRVKIRSGMVVVDQSSEQCDNEDRYDDGSSGRELARNVRL